MLLVNLQSSPLHLRLFFIIVCWGEGEGWTGHWVHVAVGVFIDCISNVEIINYFMKLNKKKSWKLHVHSYKHNFKSTCTCKCDWLKLHFRWGYMKWKSVFYFLNIKVMDMIVNIYGEFSTAYCFLRHWFFVLYVQHPYIGEHFPRLLPTLLLFLDDYQVGTSQIVMWIGYRLWNIDSLFYKMAFWTASEMDFFKFSFIEIVRTISLPRTITA